jgi:hypothetical protein
MANTRKNKQDVHTHQLKFNISEDVYARMQADKDQGYWADKFDSEFATYLIWLGSNVYEDEVLKIELRVGKNKKPSTEITGRVAGE